MLSIIENILYPLLISLIIIAPSFNLELLDIKKKHYFFLTIIFYIFYLFVQNKNLSDNITYLDIPILLIYFYYFTRNIYSSVIQVVLTISLIGVSDSLVGTLFLKLFNLKYSQILSNINLLILAQIAILLITTIISTFLKILLKETNFSFVKKHINNKNSSNISSVVYIIILIAILFLYLILLSKQTNNKSISNEDFFIFTFTFVSFIFTLLIIIVTTNAKVHIKQQYYNKELKHLNNYIKSIEDMSTNLRKFKHDYSNIILTLGEYINSNDIEGRKDFYYNDLVVESKDVLNQDQTLSSLKYINDIPLKSFISSKILQATSEKINVHIEIAEEIPQISMRILELCRVLGIFFDNAIEACKTCDKKILNFAIINNDDSIIIIVQNSCNDNVPPIYKLFEKNFSTKGPNRGLGLSNVVDIINKTHHRVTLNTTCKNNLFTQELHICQNK